MAKFLRVVEWDQFQHYKDRNPQWIKLHTSTLTSPIWYKADDSQKVLIVVVMLMAARHGNSIPADPAFIQQIGHLKAKPNLNWLVKQGFCEYSDIEDRRESPWPTRYIPDDVRTAVLTRDGNKCVKCGATEKLEIDHIVPVSKGGRGVLENLQTLCIGCNRSKRNRVSKADALRSELLRSSAQEHSLEKSREENLEETEEKEPIPQSPHLDLGHLKPPESSDELLESILKLHPANWHWRNSKTKLQLPQAQCNALIEAIGRSGLDAVLAGTKIYATFVEKSPGFVVRPERFYGNEAHYLKKLQDWEGGNGKIQPTQKPQNAVELAKRQLLEQRAHAAGN